MPANVDRTSSVPASSDTVVYNKAPSSVGCTSFLVSVPSASSYGVIVHVDTLHVDNEYVPVAAGQSLIFRLFDKGIVRVALQGDGGTATNVAWGPIGKTKAHQ